MVRNHPTETPSTSLAPPQCEQCAEAKAVMVAMVPGRDGQEWWLCAQCWLDGLRPMNQHGDEPVAPLVRAVEPAKPPRKTPKRKAS